jgi:hypothetical protein
VGNEIWHGRLLNVIDSFITPQQEGGFQGGTSQSVPGTNVTLSAIVPSDDADDRWMEVE